MVDVKQVATVALSSALADWETGYTPSLPTIREIRLALSLLTEGEPSADELRPFLGEGWVIRSGGRCANATGLNAVSRAEYSLAQIRALAVRLGMPEGFVAARLCESPSTTAPRSAETRSAETIAGLIDLMAVATNQQEDWMSPAWYALIKLSNGNQQRVEVVADTQANARLMIEAQYGRNVIISGPHQMRSR